MRVGIISDTHKLLRPEVERRLRGCDYIVHAGDIGAPAVIAGLERYAPVTAVRGNVDRDAWADRFPERATLRAGGARLFVIHDIADLDFDPASEGFDAVIYGHSHKPSKERRDGVLYLNPGSAGPRRFSLPIAMATLTVTAAGGLRARIAELPV